MQLHCQSPTLSRSCRPCPQRSNNQIIRGCSASCTALVGFLQSVRKGQTHLHPSAAQWCQLVPAACQHSSAPAVVPAGSSMPAQLSPHSWLCGEQDCAVQGGRAVTHWTGCATEGCAAHPPVMAEILQTPLLCCYESFQASRGKGEGEDANEENPKASLLW